MTMASCVWCILVAIVSFVARASPLIGTLENSESVDTIIADDGFEVTCVGHREDSTHLNKISW